MGWTVFYKIKTEHPIQNVDTAEMERITAKWIPLLHEGCEDIWFETVKGDKASELFAAYDQEGRFVPAEIDPRCTYLWGFTKVQFSKEPPKDFVTVLRAMKELALARPSWSIVVSDDYETTDGYDTGGSGNIKDIDLEAVAQSLSA